MSTAVRRASAATPSWIRWVVGVTALVSSLLLLISPARSNPALYDPAVQPQCGGTITANGAASTPNGTQLPSPSTPAGYTCFVLLNKGQLPKFEVVGYLYVKQAGSTLTMKVDMFTGSDTSVSSDSKLCLDDDTDPVNDIAPGGESPDECVGGAAPNVYDHAKLLSGQQTLKPAATAPEEGADSWEAMIQKLASTDTGGLETFTVDINGYTEFNFHFNANGFSINSFFQPPRDTQLNLVKTAVDSSITIGEKFSYSITVSDVQDGVAPINLTVTDDLVPGDRDWTITSQPAADACSIGADGSGNLDRLSCSPTLADGGSYGPIVVETASAASAALCDTSHRNVAVADADNAPEVSDDATIDVQCGAVKVVKTAKHADTSGDTHANLEATFEITDANGATHSATTDHLSGVACVDDLPLGSAKVVEKTGPAGYQKDADEETVTVTDADCPEPGAGATAQFENIPLTDITWSVDSLHEGGTRTVVDCRDKDGNSLPGYPKTLDGDGDGSDTLPNILPTDPSVVTIQCDFSVDP